MRGIIHVTGGHDTGKTSFALECGASPDRICFVDDDVKGQGTVKQLAQAGIEFGSYHNFTLATKGKTELDIHKLGLGIIGNLKPSQYDAIIWDTWTRFAKTCHSAVQANPAKFRKYWSAMGRIKGAEQWQEAANYEAAIIAAMNDQIPLIILVTHLKDDYKNNVKTGRTVPAASRTLARVPNLRLWLCHNPNSPVPIALLLKRLDAKKMTDKGLRTVCITPRRIVPRPDDTSLWDAITRYLETPVGNRELTEEEQPNAAELSILDGTLTEDQKLAWRVGLKESQHELDMGGVPPMPPRKRTRTTDIVGEGPPHPQEKEIRGMATAGDSKMDIAKALGIPLREVIMALKG